MKAVCPNDTNHKEFITVAHIMQDWKVDENGEWLEKIDPSVQTSYNPNSDNIWTCAACGVEAKVDS
jgi:hypothetical protein